MNQPKQPVLESPNGFLFEVRITLEAGNEHKVYVNSFTESFDQFNIPPHVQDIYPDAPAIYKVNVALIAAVSARIVPGARMLKEGEELLPTYTKDGKVPF